MCECVSFLVEANTLLFEIEEVRYLLSWNRFVCWLSMWECVPFWEEANTFTIWDWGDALPSELIQFRLLIEYVGMRSLLSRSRFVCWLGMWWCVSFWVEANTLLFEIEEVRYLLKLILIRLLIEYVGMRSLLSRSIYVCCLRLRGCVTFRVDTVSFADWACGNAFLLSRSRFVCWLSVWVYVSFWVEANKFTVWVWGDALPSELIQFRLLIEYVGMRSLLSRSRFVTYLSMWGCVSFWDEANSFADYVCGDAFPFKLIQFRLLIEYVGMS